MTAGEYNFATRAASGVEPHVATLRVGVGVRTWRDGGIVRGITGEGRPGVIAVGEIKAGVRIAGEGLGAVGGQDG